MPITKPLWMVKLEPLIKGPYSLVRKFNYLVDCIDELREAIIEDRIVVGRNLAESQTPDGRKLDVISDGGLFGSEPIEFALYNASSGTTLKIGVKFGNFGAYRTADGLVPYPADDYTEDSDYKYEETVTATGHVWMEFANDTSGDFDVLDSVVMGCGPTMPTSTDTVGYLPLGTYRVAGSPAVLTILSGAQGVGNQMYNFADGAHVWGPL